MSIWTEIAHTQFSGAPNGGTTPGINTTTADLIVVLVAHYTAGPSASFSDSQGNNWTLMETTGVTGNMTIELYYADKGSSGGLQTNSSHTFSVSGTGIYASIMVDCFSGSQPSSGDQHNSANTGAGTVTSVQPGSITPSLNNELVVFAWADGGTSQVGDGAYTTDETNNFTGGNNYGGGISYAPQTTATATNPTASWTTAAAGAAAIASFKAGTTKTINLVKGDLTLNGQTVTFTNTAPGYIVVKGNLTLAGKAVQWADSFPGTKGNLTLTGEVVTFSNTSGSNIIFNLVKGNLSLSGKTVGLSNGAAIIVSVRAPYLTTDTIGTKFYDVYDSYGGLISSNNSAGFFDSGNGNITNAWGVDMPLIPNGPANDLSFAGVAVFKNIGSGSAAIPLYSPPQHPPSSLVICEMAPFLTNDTINTPGYVVRPSQGSFGSHIITGIWAIPGVTNGYATSLSFTPNANGGYQYTNLWDGG
jgi:hypothetical protein